jgi:metal-sulfur cluster biosynthetic enzyme
MTAGSSQVVAGSIELAATPLDSTTVLDVLDGIVDPCAANAGVPIGIVSMGLVHDLVIANTEEGAVVSLGVTVTEPMCVMYHHFAIEADRRIRLLEGVHDVKVTVLPYRMWTEENIEPASRERLAASRREKQAVALPLPVRRAVP